MDDEVIGGWVIDTAVRDALRLDRARTAFERGDYQLTLVEAEELLDDSPDHAEGLALLGQATLIVGDAEGAAAILNHAFELSRPSGALLSVLALARFESCDLHGSVTAAREAIRLCPDLAPAHYTLALALDLIPHRTSEAAVAFAAAHRLDAREHPFPVVWSPEQWAASVAQALLLTNDTVRAFWSGVEVLLIPEPDLDELRASKPPLPPSIRGLFQGPPPTDPAPSDDRPSALRLFMKPLARLGDEQTIIDAIADVLEHEALEWLGASPEELGLTSADV